MTETYWCPGPWPWQWFRTCTREVPDPLPDPCNAPECVDAKKRLDTARSRFKQICDAARSLKVFMDLLRGIVSIPIWVIVALIAIMIVATLIGGVVGVLAVILLGFLAVYAISWILLPLLAPLALELASALAKQLIAFNTALKDVVSQCPERCRGDVSVPECQL